MSNEERVAEAPEAEEGSVHDELARIDQTDAIVRLVEAGQISCLDPSRYVAIPVPEDMTPKLAAGLAGAGAAAELFAAWGKSNLALVLNGSIDDLRAAKDGLGLIPRFLGPDGKVTALARLQKVQLDPAELSAAALQVAAAYVQAQYMEDIDRRLAGIEGTLSGIKGMLEDQRISKVESAYNLLTSYYIPNLVEYLEDDAKLIPARSQVLAIIKELNDSWTEQVHATQRLCERVLGESKPDERRLKELSSALVADDKVAAAIFGTLCIADQARMLYYQELSSEQISLVESQEQGMLANYLALRSTIVERLDKDIDRIRRAPLAFPSPLEEPEREEARGVFEKAGRAVDAFARRATSDTPWGAAKKQASEHREALKAAYPHDQRTEVPCGVICEENVRNLGLIDIALNKADTVALLDDKLYFIYEGGEAESELATEGDGQQPQTA